MSLTGDIRARSGLVSKLSGFSLSRAPLIYELGTKGLHGLFPMPSFLLPNCSTL